ncbi:IFT46 [Scenedesmus sp. PABB004]|nr:IFT46 [Scenedesmus sp. PABB004]
MAAMDDEFDYGDEPRGAGGEQERLRHMGSMRRAAVAVQNQPHDEEVALSESESCASPDDCSPSSRGAASHPEASADSLGAGAPSPPPPQHAWGAAPAAAAAQQPPEQQRLDGGRGLLYDSQDYAGLVVPDDVRALFGLIASCAPPVIELGAPLRPFIPDYIPALGGPDEFVKVPRPDGRADGLGTRVLDEPAAAQSDAGLLALQLRALGKEAPGGGGAPQVVVCIPHGAPDARARLGAWVSSVAALHKARPAAAVAYSRPMPDVEALMQEWPPELEAALRGSRLPTADLELDLLSFAKLVCALLDVPVHGDGGVVESLHLLLTLHAAFRANPFFRGALDDAARRAGPPEISMHGGRMASESNAALRGTSCAKKKGALASRVLRWGAASLRASAPETTDAPAAGPATAPDGSARVQVTILLERRVAFGESLAVVGSGGPLGAWSPAGGLRLTWGEGDVWRGQVALAPGVHEFKCVTVRPDGGAEWEGGDNRVIQVPDDNACAGLEARCAWADTRGTAVTALAARASSSCGSAGDEPAPLTSPRALDAAAKAAAVAVAAAGVAEEDADGGAPAARGGASLIAHGSYGALGAAVAAAGSSDDSASLPSSAAAADSGSVSSGGSEPPLTPRGGEGAAAPPSGSSSSCDAGSGSTCDDMDEAAAAAAAAAAAGPELLAALRSPAGRPPLLPVPPTPFAQLGRAPGAGVTSPGGASVASSGALPGAPSSSAPSCACSSISMELSADALAEADGSGLLGSEDGLAAAAAAAAARPPRGNADAAQAAAVAGGRLGAAAPFDQLMAAEPAAAHGDAAAAAAAAAAEAVRVRRALDRSAFLGGPRRGGGAPGDDVLSAAGELCALDEDGLLAGPLLPREDTLPPAGLLRFATAARDEANAYADADAGDDAAGWADQAAAVAGAGEPAAAGAGDTPGSGFCRDQLPRLGLTVTVPTAADKAAAEAAAMRAAAAEVRGAPELPGGEVPVAREGLRLIAAAHLIPHVDKVSSGGEDAYFISPAGHGALGVSDGVSAWAEDGIDPGDYSRTLAQHCAEGYEARVVTAARAAAAGSYAAKFDARGVLRYAQQATVKPGSATVVLAALQPGGRLHVANLGDCGVKVVRDWRVLHATAPQQHDFNLPYQLSHPRLFPDTDTADSADRYVWDVQEGDIVVAASDGLYDNLWDDELLALLQQGLLGAAPLGGGALPGATDKKLGRGRGRAGLTRSASATSALPGAGDGAAPGGAGGAMQRSRSTSQIGAWGAKQLRAWGGRGKARASASDLEGLAEEGSGDAAAAGGAGSGLSAAAAAAAAAGGGVRARTSPADALHADVSRAAELLAAAAAAHAADKEFKSPWSVAAGKAYGLLARLFAKGGKMDDITVVVAVVQDAGKAAALAAGGAGGAAAVAASPAAAAPRKRGSPAGGSPPGGTCDESSSIGEASCSGSSEPLPEPAPARWGSGGDDSAGS